VTSRVVGHLPAGRGQAPASCTVPAKVFNAGYHARYVLSNRDIMEFRHFLPPAGGPYAAISEHQDLAVIESLEMTFQPGLNVMSGEPAPASPSSWAPSACCWRPRLTRHDPDSEETAIVQAVFEHEGREVIVRRELNSAGPKPQLRRRRIGKLQLRYVNWGDTGRSARRTSTRRCSTPTSISTCSTATPTSGASAQRLAQAFERWTATRPSSSRCAGRSATKMRAPSSSASAGRDRARRPRGRRG